MVRILASAGHTVFVAATQGWCGSSHRRYRKHGCVPTKLYSWTLTFEFLIISICHNIFPQFSSCTEKNGRQQFGDPWSILSPHSRTSATFSYLTFLAPLTTPTPTSTLLTPTQADLPKLLIISLLLKTAKNLGGHLKPLSFRLQYTFPPLPPHSLNFLSPLSLIFQINDIHFCRLHPDLFPDHRSSI